MIKRALILCFVAMWLQGCDISAYDAKTGQSRPVGIVEFIQIVLKSLHIGS